MYKIGTVIKQHKLTPIKDLSRNGILIFFGTNPAPLVKTSSEKPIDMKTVFILNSGSKG
jgi:hypothetical protein